MTPKQSNAHTKGKGMKDNDLVTKLTQAAERAGLKPMSQEEFDDWWTKCQEYQNSQEGKAVADAEEIQLDYLLERAKYKFTADMGEISGFGGSYEKACRVMCDAGLRWFDDHLVLARCTKLLFLRVSGSIRTAGTSMYRT